jgi:LacI family transcriptional regulator
MRSRGGTGIIARVEAPAVARAILASGLPTIALGLSDEQLRPDSPLSRLGEVVSDSRGGGRMAAEHLLERGFRHYAYVGAAGRVWSGRRQEGFRGRIREAGFEPRVYDPPRTRRSAAWD